MPNFTTKHTAAGLEAMTAAQVSGTPINLTHMAVGDGNGNPVTFTGAETALVREVYRSTINRVFKPDPSGDPARFSAELVVPASEGGFVMREVGVFDSDGTLFAIGNLPETYKPEASEGAFADTVVRLDFVASNADVVTVQADPSIAVASQQWVTNNVTAATLIPGGTTGQVLTKDSNADGDYIWQDATEANVIVQTIEETQTLADAQTTVTLAVVNTVGLAVYIEGVRIPQDSTADGWEPDGSDPAVLTLGKSYPAGTQLFAVQNEPAAGFPDALLRDQNLADVPDKALGRENLGVYSRAQTDQKAPAGMVAHFARNTAPAGWMKANGAAVSRSTYADLFNAIGTTFGAGNGVDTFNLPDLRGEFLRAWDDGRGVDAGRAFGSGQAFATAAPQTTTPSRILGDGSTDSLGSGATNPSAVGFVRPSKSGEGVTGSGHDSGGSGVDMDTRNAVTGDPETRPRNVALLACIKF